jgi:hypothetical protein
MGFFFLMQLKQSLCLKEETAAETFAKQKINIEYVWVTRRPVGVHILCSRRFVDAQYIVIGYVYC